MQDFDSARAREHRLREAEAGFPLLRGCASTAAIERLAFLDALSDAERIDFAGQLSELDSAQKTNPQEPFDALLRASPLVEACFAARRAPALGVAFMPVKLYAGVCKDTGVGGFAGWAKMVGMPVEAQAPAAAHAASLAEFVPVAPRRLRKLVDDALTARSGAVATRISSDHTRYVAPLSDGGFTVDIMFPRGMGPSYQFEHHFNAKMTSGRGIWMKNYESVWRTMSRWDYVTETNAGRSIGHLARLIETCIDLI